MMRDQACSVLQTSSLRFKTSVYAVLLVFGLALLQGCGFHLRGYGMQAEAQFKSVKLTQLSQVEGNIQQALIRQLQSQGVIIADSLANAELEVVFEKTAVHQSRTAYTGTGDVASLLLTLKQSFRVQEVASETVLLDTQVSAYRDHHIDNTALLASNRELEEIRQQMAQEVAMQVIERINRALLNRTPAQPTTEPKSTKNPGGDSE